jgi:Beta-lactamase
MRTPQVDVPGVSGLLANRWGLGFELFDWGGEVFGHDGGTIGQSTFWRVVPGSDFAVAMSVNGDGFIGLFLDVVLPMIREATGLAVPDFPVPAQAPQAVDPTPYTGRYSEPELAYEVAAADGGLEVTMIPGEFMTEAGARRTSARYVHHGGHSFITAEPENGRHGTVTFIVEDGRAAYLHNGRALPRA